jgi:hypothetical protein
MSYTITVQARAKGTRGVSYAPVEVTAENVREALVKASQRSMTDWVPQREN